MSVTGVQHTPRRPVRAVYDVQGNVITSICICHLALSLSLSLCIQYIEGFRPE